MAQASPPSNTRNITPQVTGFSQVHSRGGGEGGGQAMSVLLSWHEKVRPRISDMACRTVHDLPLSIEASLGNFCLLQFNTDSVPACRDSWPRLNREGHDRSTHCLSRALRIPASE